jgi:hypothetical protein
VSPQPEPQPDSPQYAPQEEDSFKIVATVPTRKNTQEAQQPPQNDNHDDDHDNDDEEEEAMRMKTKMMRITLP